MGGVLDGQSVSASTTNPAFIDANGDDTGVGKITLANTDPVSGATVDSLQKEHNSAASFMGKAINTDKDDLPAWTTSVVGAAGDSLFDRADALTERFDASTGHSHDGTAGEGPKVEAINIDAVPLRGFVLQGADVFGVTGSSSDVSSSFSGKTPGGSAFVEGVVTAAPENKVIVRQASGVDEDTEFHDAFGNHVYARLTEAAGTWTLSYYSSIAGVETAYSFAVSSDVRYYYQEIFNPLGGNAPVYSEFASIPSDNATADILTATTTIQGKVQLATTAQPVGSSSSAGTANASVANENHTHAGVHSVAKSGSTGLLGDVTLTGAGGTTLTQASQNIEVSSPALSTATPSAIASTGSAGSATTTSKSDHTHEGVHAVKASGNPDITGDVTIGVSGGAGISQAGSTITISAPALASTAPADVGSSASIGSGTTSAKADHVHRGVTSVSKSGSSQLFGNVTLSAGTGISLTQAAQNIEIATTGGGAGSGVQLLWNDDPSIVYYNISDYVPGANIYERNKYSFIPLQEQGIEAVFRVPSGYTVGNPITFKFNHANGTSGTYYFVVWAGILNGEYSTSVAAPYSTASVTASLSIKSSSVIIAPSGSIGPTPVQPGDLIWVYLLSTAGGFAAITNVTVFGSSSEVTFS